jgi:hypothetical protein
MFWLLIEYVIESNLNKARYTENFALLFGPQWHVKMTLYTFLSYSVSSYKARNEITVFATYCCNLTSVLYTVVVCLLMC